VQAEVQVAVVMEDLIQLLVMVLMVQQIQVVEAEVEHMLQVVWVMVALVVKESL
jgi:hypothetical protein